MVNKKIKILIFSPSLQCGGSEKHVANLCNNIDANKFEVVLILINNTSPFYQIKNPNIEVIDLKASRLLHGIIKLLKLIRLKNPHIVYSTSNHLNLLLAIIKFWLPKDVKLIARESSVVSINHLYSPYPKLYNFLLKAFYKKIPLIVCQSKSMQQDLIANYGLEPQQTTLIYNGIEDVDYRNEFNKSVKPHFLSVARLSPEKGIDRVLNALSLLQFDFNYTIIGGGTEKNKLQQLAIMYKIENKVFFAGQQYKPFVNIENVDLFLMASQYEGFPNTLLEATSYGIPVVAFNSPGGISEIVEDGVNGFLVNSDNTEDFAKTINKALEYNFDRQKIKQLTQTKFSLQKSIQQLQTLFISSTK
ncbi:MAG: glycosyltransferase [Ferruginibacter sp.]|nr:glycosyltransferase [Ferruginibacter sp.]